LSFAWIARMPAPANFETALTRRSSSTASTSAAIVILTKVPTLSTAASIRRAIARAS
jgi:hypothetical protein